MRGHDERRCADAESSDGSWMPHAQSAATSPRVPTQSEETNDAQVRVPPVQGQSVEESSVQQHDEGDCDEDFVEETSV